VQQTKIPAVVVLLTLLSACSFRQSNISINSIQEVQSIFAPATRETLFIFDVDDVILEPTEPSEQTRFHAKLKPIHKNFQAFMKAHLDPELFTSKCLLKHKIQPVEQTLLDTILALQKRNIKVIALTKLHTGKFGLIERLEDMRYKQLLSLGLDLSLSFGHQDIRFDELQKTPHATKYTARNKTKPNPAVFYNGILSTGSFTKGTVLKAFLEKMRFRPTQIYFFDDKMKNVTSVMQEMKPLGIKCKAFVYKAATVHRSPKDLNIEVARLQHELMKQREDYVSYFEAQELLAKQRPIQGRQ
jgi:Protein of unknown function (DUF2608).